MRDTKICFKFLYQVIQGKLNNNFLTLSDGRI
jgi:hypothetical protein